MLNPLHFPQGLPQPWLPPRRRNPPAAADGEGARGGLHLRGAGGHLQQVRKKKRLIHSNTIFFLPLQIAEAAAAQFPLAFRQERLLQAKVRPPQLPPQPGTYYARNPLGEKKSRKFLFSAHRTRGEPTTTTTSGAATATGSIPTTKDTTVRNRETKIVYFLFHFNLRG